MATRSTWKEEEEQPAFSQTQTTSAVARQAYFDQKQKPPGATRELMPQEDITHTTPSMVTPTEAREAGECGKGEPCGPPKTKPQRRLARRGLNQVDHRARG